ncbi:MAG: hypothetical protein LBT19_00935 [Candidatus Nomurabacteria bacterium]|jgi:hypothetical protein|nr:hypothetical protein [Candidatus Nomurabacteria bacterium]
MGLLKNLADSYRENKVSFRVWVILQVLVVATMVRHIVSGDMHSAFVCLLTLALFLAPALVKRTFKVMIPTMLEVLVLCFIFSAEILGEINNYYMRIPSWDTILHTLNGFAAAGVGLSLMIMVDAGSQRIKMTAGFTALMAFCFSMTVGVVWEFGEYFADSFLGKDAQRDTFISEIYTVSLDETRTNTVIYIGDIQHTVLYGSDGEVVGEFDGYLDVGLHDTMKDLLVNAIGAGVFCVFGYFYVKYGKLKFLNNWLIRKKTD